VREASKALGHQGRVVLYGSVSGGSMICSELVTGLCECAHGGDVRARVASG